MEVLAHRIVWSVVLLVAWLVVVGRFVEVRQAFRHRRIALMLSTLLLANNWFVFIWAVTHAKVLQASFGYFINPLLNVLLGFVILRERLRRAQWISVLLAGLGVTLLTVASGEVPIIALVLAGSFGLYGLLRKVARVEGMAGLTVETSLLMPAAVAYLVFLSWRGELSSGHVARSTDLLLILAGVITALPLVWFANAVRRLRLATVGG